MKAGNKSYGKEVSTMSETIEEREKSLRIRGNWDPDAGRGQKSWKFTISQEKKSEKKDSALSFTYRKCFHKKTKLSTPNLKLGKKQNNRHSHKELHFFHFCWQGTSEEATNAFQSN